MSAPASDVGQVQRRASDPAASAWVSANAGSGKTFVLAQRVVRLLLAGADPARILCLTFTKAAAAEMAKRVFDDLAKWTRLDDDALAAAIEAIEGRAPAAIELQVARRLFARALETPGGLKIQTIHAFCEQLLHRFPFEANVAGHFEVLDERSGSALIEEAQSTVLASGSTEPEGPLGRALARVATAVGDAELFRVIAEFVARRDLLRAWIRPHASLQEAGDTLREALGLSPADDTLTIRRRYLSETAFSQNELRQLAARLAAGGPQDRDAGANLAAALSADTESERVEGYLNLFFTRSGEPRRSIVTAAVQTAFPGLAARLDSERLRLELLRDLYRAADCWETSMAMVVLADAVITAYEHEKGRKGVLDFEDLIVKTAALLIRADAREWVHYKLDQGIDHILVDEAQDTSPRQWQVIQSLVAEFFAGQGSRERLRTVFAVGDEKQSIYSFQGAAPAWFDRVRRELRQKAVEAQLGWVDVPLHLSFRSSPDLLSAVDQLFGSPAAHKGLSSEGRPPPHIAMRRHAPGDVLIWDPFEAPANEPPEDWTAPLDRMTEASPEAQLAERIAATIHGWLARAETLPGTGAPIRPGNILILTRKRGSLHGGINRALKRSSIPIAGVDRMALLEHVAVLDLLALAEVMLLPEDDLSLAALFKSPLLSLDEHGLFQLAHGRAGSLWQALAAAAAAQPLLFGPTFVRLEAWRARADFLAPFDFYARILGAEGGRRDYARRLGAEAEDVLDEFLAEALAYERTEPPSLQGFLAWMKATTTEIRRDPAAPRDEVRVMTVHGAKGLEAEIVFLVDDGSVISHQNHDPRIVELVEGAGPLAWYRGPASSPRIVSARIDEFRERAAEEYRRLLYVAATRARDRLIVCGISRRRSEAGSWYALIRSALAPGSAAVEGADGEAVLRWPIVSTAVPAAAAPLAAESPPVAKAEGAMPAWITQRPPPRPASRILSPSRSGAVPPAAKSMSPLGPFSAPRAGMERGRILHRMLQALPELPIEDRSSAARRYLEQAAPAWPAADREEAVGEVLAVLSDPGFAEAFAPGSRAEIALAGALEGRSGRFAIRGQVDRLAVTASRLLIVDYKTNRPPPRVLGEVPADYLRQLALYRQVLCQLYPGRALAAALLWTSGPRLMEIPNKALDESIADLFDPPLTVV